MYYIGFSNKYYTLWNIEEETSSLGNGCNYVITHYWYIKNISFDKDKAFAQYPEAVFDENLCGMTRSWSSRPKEVWTCVDVFRFGKYKFDKIAENTDTSYIEWYWGNIDGEHKEFVGEVLKSRGYEIRTQTYTYRDYNTGKMRENTHTWLVSPEMLEEEKKANDLKNQIMNKFNNHENFELYIEHNIDSDGEIEIDDITYKFEEVKENCYNGYIYYLPVINGKAKRIKNKNIIITDYDFEYLDENNEYPLINIKNFEIKK